MFLIKRKTLFGRQIWRFEGMKVYWPYSGDDHMVNGNGGNMFPNECHISNRSRHKEW